MVNAGANKFFDMKTLRFPKLTLSPKNVLHS